MGADGNQISACKKKELKPPACRSAIGRQAADILTPRSTGQKWKRGEKKLRGVARDVFHEEGES